MNDLYTLFERFVYLLLDVKHRNPVKRKVKAR